jgi:hypothetical protein
MRLACYMMVGARERDALAACGREALPAREHNALPARGRDAAEAGGEARAADVLRAGALGSPVARARRAARGRQRAAAR